jgi:hypothetical protein
MIAAIFVTIFIFFIIIWTMVLQKKMISKLTPLGMTLAIIIVLSVISFTYRYFKNKFHLSENNKVNNFFEIIINTILVIPCFIKNIYDFCYLFILFLFLSGELPTFPVLFNFNDIVSIGILIAIFIIVIFYLQIKRLTTKFTTQNGNVLIEEPVYLNKQIFLKSFGELNKNRELLPTNYAISFQVYLHSTSTDNNSNNYYASLVNLNEKPNILYNSFTNTCILTYLNEKIKEEQEQEEEQEKNSFHEMHNKNKIIFKTSFLSQKWNHIIINVNNGTMDFFLNGNLKYTYSNISPCNETDSITVGEDKGIQGGISNLTYFNEPLTTSNIFFLYNSMKYFPLPV